MNMHFSSRGLRTLLTVVGAVLYLFLFLATSSSATGSQRDGMLFDGGAYGPTPEVAVQSAIWDAEESASTYQLYTCQLVGEPRIFPGPNPEWGRNFSAQVTVECTP
jgi:hypothetical protein